ncbi:MAG: hypothetical protein ACE5L7_09660 [Candidatus Aminicenantales bacterium]
MEILSFIIIILLSSVGYCFGAVSKAGKSAQPKPQMIDLILVVLIWAGAIYSRIHLDLNKWILILIWLSFGIIIGMFAAWPRKFPEEKLPIRTRTQPILSHNFFLKLWQKWKNFSLRMGNFHSRIMLSLLFFVFVSPFALAVKIFADPLHIKHRSTQSHWHSKKEIKANLELFKRQF